MQSEHAVTRGQRIIRLITVGAQAFVLMLAGYETTAAALSFTLYLLAANPDKQQLLVDEVDSFGRDRKPSLEDLESLPFLDACLKEGLRLYPPAPTHIREAARDTEIGGYRVRKGQWLGCAVWSMHRNPKYWKVTMPHCEIECLVRGKPFPDGICPSETQYEGRPSYQQSNLL